MRTTILLLCLLGSTQSLPKQLNPASGLPPTKPAPDQVMLVKQQLPSQVLPSLSLIPLTQVLALGADLQLISPSTGVAPGTQTRPVSLGALNGQQQLQPQMLPIIVAQLGAQGTLLSSEELPLASQVFTGLFLHPLFPGSILPTNQAGSNPDAQKGVLPAGQTGTIQGTTEGHIPVSTDDDFAMTTPAGLRKGAHTTGETTPESTSGKKQSLDLVIVTIPKDRHYCSKLLRNNIEITQTEEMAQQMKCLHSSFSLDLQNPYGAEYCS
uniref:amelotin n=1 Tax=Jaculus jaculus TaxID=51337 RepID=UPI001E1B08F5|nr:amelotin [Jaculus jaculus]